MLRRAEPDASSTTRGLSAGGRAVAAVLLAAALCTCAVGADPNRGRDVIGGGGDGLTGDATGDVSGPPPDAPRCTGSTCSLPNASARCEGGMCLLGACNRGFADADGNPGNGCECETGMAGDTCTTGQNLGTLMPGSMQMARGAVGRMGGELWFTASFADGGHPRITVAGGPYRFDLRFSCMSTERYTCTDRMEGATALTTWEFFDNPPMMGTADDAGTGMGMSMPTRMTSYPSSVAIRVFAPTPTMGCQSFMLTVSN